jgi:cystathionine beta-lyase
VILQKSLYGGTINLVNTEFKKFNIGYDYVDVSNHDELQGALNSKTKIIYIESPSNPLLSITDIKSIASFAKENNLISIIDNTFASPVNQNPISLGIDLVIHSATKYLGGHSDILAGVVCGSNDLISVIKKSGLNFGSNISEYISWLLERSIKTLSVRVLQQNNNASKIANFLSSHKKINKVYYPGLVNHPKHDVANTQMTAGFGGMVSFELNDSIDSDEFVKTLKIIQPTMSLAGVESTITSPAKTSHRKMNPKDRNKIGITKNLLRFSVGIEDADDLIKDLSNALEING